MGATIGTGDGDKKSVNVELNIIPYIDLMSCLTAFLLVTAVWIGIAQISIEPKGKARNGDPSFERPEISVLMQADTIYIGVSHMAVDPVVIRRAPGGDFDWAAVETTLASLKKDEAFAERTDLEIAAESTPTAPLTYDPVVHAMDIAVKVGFAGVGLSEPSSLSWRPTL